MRLRLIAAVCFFAAVPLGAYAQAPQQTRVEDACRAETASLCAASGDKRGAAFRCLLENESKLGAGCATAIKVARERREALQAACKADGDKMCGTAKGGQLFACLRDHKAELSKSCSDAIAALPQPAAKQ